MIDPQISRVCGCARLIDHDGQVLLLLLLLLLLTNHVERTDYTGSILAAPCAVCLY